MCLSLKALRAAITATVRPSVAEVAEQIYKFDDPGIINANNGLSQGELQDHEKVVSVLIIDHTRVPVSFIK